MTSLYSYVKFKVIWYRDNDSSHQVDLSRYITTITTRKDFKPINNICNITIIDNDLLYESGAFLPQEDDKFFIWAKIVESTSDATFTTDDIIWNGKFIDHSRVENQDDSLLTLKIGDWGYDVFNRYHGESYIDGTLKTDEIIKRLIQVASEKDDGTYKIDTTNVASTRNDGSAFPLIKYGSISKPDYEWFEELSSTQWTNSETEISTGTKVINYPMILDFRGNYAYWYEQSLTSIMTIDNDTQVLNIKYNTNNEGTVSFLILDCGEDLDGNSITTYIRDEDTNTAIKKERFKPQLSLAGKDNTYDNTYHYLRKEADDNSWTNSEFRTKVKSLAESFAESWFRYAGRGKDEIMVTIPKVDVELGEIITVSRSRFNNGSYRVVSVANNIGTEWSTTLNIEKFTEV